MDHFGGFQYFFFLGGGGGGGGGGVSENEYVFGHENFVDVFWGHHKTGLGLGVISMHFRAMYRNWGYFLGLIKFQIFLGVCLIAIYGHTTTAIWVSSLIPVLR